MLFAELALVTGIYAGYAFESVCGCDLQNVVDLFPGLRFIGIPGCRALCSDSVNFDTDDSCLLRESKVRPILLRTLT